MEKKKATTTRTRATTPKTAAAKKTTAPRAAAPRSRKAVTATAAASTPSVTTPTGAAGAGFRPSHEQIAAFAYSLFEQSGQQHGRALEHWLEAESKLQQGLKL
ncbi:MAG: DUF2934 domain-containing protein [Candidatus Eisenbacteria bacterium]